MALVAPIARNISKQSRSLVSSSELLCPQAMKAASTLFDANQNANVWREIVSASHC